MIKFEQTYDLDSLNYILILIFADKNYLKIPYFKTRTLWTFWLHPFDVNKCAMIVI